MRECTAYRHYFGFRAKSCYCEAIHRVHDGSLEFGSEIRQRLDWEAKVKAAGRKIAQEVERLKAQIPEPPRG